MGCGTGLGVLSFLLGSFFRLFDPSVENLGFTNEVDSLLGIQFLIQIDNDVCLGFFVGYFFDGCL